MDNPIRCSQCGQEAFPALDPDEVISEPLPPGWWIGLRHRGGRRPSIPPSMAESTARTVVDSYLCPECVMAQPKGHPAHTARLKLLVELVRRA